MERLVAEAIEAYAERHTTPAPEPHEALRRVTEAQTRAAQMRVGAVEGRLLTLLARLTGARLAVEIGTFTGCSALHIAEGLAADGRLITCDVDAEATAIAREHWAASAWGHKIELRLGPALDTLRTLDGPFDLAFIDADKRGYVDYWEAILPKLRRGGIVVADNVLWSGRVLDPQSEDDRALAAFNAHVAADPRVEQVLLTVRDGITLAVRS